MSIAINRFDLNGDDAAEWNGLVERSDTTTPLFRAEALTLQAQYTDTELYALAGYKGREGVGIVPVFEDSRGPVSAVFSPAPFAWSGYLGPALLNVDKLKRRKTDRRNRRFVEGCLAFVDGTISPVYTRIIAGECEDGRPFEWNGYTVEPGFTYVVRFGESADALLDRFSSDARSNVRNVDPDDDEVDEGGVEDVGTIVEQVRARYESQDRAFHLSREYAESLYETLPDGTVRPYVRRIDGEVVGGLLVLESDDTRYRWLGGAKPGGDVDVPVNDLLDWHVMRDGLERGLERYDLVGAGVPSINRYEAKFNPDLETHYTITSGKLGLDAVVKGYRKLR